MVATMRSAALGLFFVFFAPTTAVSACYDAKGTVLDSGHNEYGPCSDPGLSTICCGINRPNPPGGDASNGFTKDECLPNGLCQNRVMKNGTMDISYVCVSWQGNTLDDINLSSQMVVGLLHRSRHC